MSDFSQNYGYFYSLKAIDRFAEGLGQSMSDWAGVSVATLLRAPLENQIFGRAAIKAMLERAVQHFEGRCLGLEVGRRYDVTSFGIPGLAMMASATLGEGLAVGLEYRLLAGCLLELELVSHDQDGLRIRLLNHRGHSEAVHRFLVLEMLAGALTFWRICTRQDSLSFKLMCDFDPDGYQQACDAFFGSKVIWNAPCCEVIVPPEVLALRLPTRNRIALQEALHCCDWRMAQVRQSLDFIDSVSLCIRQRLGQRPSAKVIAVALGMSERTLHRRLSEATLKFKSICNELQQQVDEWQQQGVGDVEIAARLGFSDATDFRRASRRWL